MQPKIFDMCSTSLVCPKSFRWSDCINLDSYQSYQSDVQHNHYYLIVSLHCSLPIDVRPWSAMVFRCIYVLFNDSDFIFMNLLLIHVSSFMKTLSTSLIAFRSFFYVFQELIFCEMYELKTIFPSGSPHLIHCTLYNLLFVSVQVRSL